MMPSLFSAVSGLKGNQEMMDVIGNNIANVNTPGFKSSSVNFANLLSQTMKGASLPTSTTGGTNPIQIGQGTNVASVDTNFTGGSLQQTGNNTDLGINGDGLFILGSGSNQYYTRDGDFSFDSSGNLVSNANGMNVNGWMANSSGTISTSAAPTNIGIDLNATAPAKVTSNMVMSGNLNSQLNNGTLAFNESETVPFTVKDTANPANSYSCQLNFSQSSTPGVWNWTTTNASTGASYSSGTVTLDSNGNVTGSTVAGSAASPPTFSIGAVTIAPPASGSTNSNAFTVTGATGSFTTDPASQSFAPTSSAASTSFTAYDGSGNQTNCKLAFTQGSAFNTWDWTVTDASTGASYGSGTVTMDSATGDVSSSSGTATIPISGTDYTIAPPTSGNANAFTIALSSTGHAAGALVGIGTQSANAATFTLPADGVIQTVYDALGDQYSVDLAFTKNSIGSWGWNVKSITDSQGTTYTPTSGGTGNLQFGDTGALPPGTNGTFSFKPTTGNIAPVSISLNFSGLTQDDADNSAAMKSQDGYTSGTLQNYTIDQTGTITGSFSNGATHALGQIALADFPNPSGLSSAGSNLFTATANSGAITVQPAGTGSLGTIKTGSLEMSNVDLSQEMSNMIIAQSGFDANSKVITTDDQLMQTLVNMIQG
jgi:flagellar hook protein FlgE